MRKTILMTLMAMLTFSITLNASTVNPKPQVEQKTTFDWTHVIEAIIQVESGGETKAKSKDGASCGILQITRVCVDDANKILGKKKYTYQDRFNVKKSKEIFCIIQNRYNPKHDFEIACRLWNGGCGWRKNIHATDAYYRKVLKKYKELGY